VCDLGKNNSRAVNLLKVSPERPYFSYLDREVFFVYDAPHIIKCIRNNLIKHDINFDGGTASWSHIKALYDIDSKDKKARAVCKLTNKNISPNSFDKMKVKYATQVFSQSVKAAMITAVGTGELPKEALETADFIGNMDEIFNCLNSRSLFDANPLRCGVSNHTPQGKQVIERLSKALPWVENLKKIVPEKQTKGKRKQNKPPCFHGLKLTIMSVLQLWKTVTEEKFNFLLTNRLTQDVLEHEFAISRMQGGFDRNPSAMKFRQNLRRRIQVTLMKPPSTSNCEVDDVEETLITVTQSPQSNQQRLFDTDGEEDVEQELEPQTWGIDSEFENEGGQEPHAPSPKPDLAVHTLENCSVR